MNRRAELKRAYKEQPPAMGVYLVHNVRRHRFVAGASRNVEGSLNRYKFMLQMGKPGDPFLRHPQMLADYRAQGGEGFEFSVLDTLKPKDEAGWDPNADLAGLEALWLDALSGRGWLPYEGR